MNLTVQLLGPNNLWLLSEHVSVTEGRESSLRGARRTQGLNPTWSQHARSESAPWVQNTGPSLWACASDCFLVEENQQHRRPSCTMSFPGARAKRFSKKVEVDSTFYKGNSKGAACKRQSALCIAHLPQSPGCCAQPRLKSRFVTAHCRNLKINIVFFLFHDKSWGNYMFQQHCKLLDLSQRCVLSSQATSTEFCRLH